MRESILIAKEAIPAGHASCVKLPFAMLYSSTPLEIPVYVFHGKKPGPVLFITAAIHGDEINGVEIIRRLHQMPVLKRLRGTLITMPLVNPYGFFLRSRYLPDRRDLNRQFPGSRQGSMASKLAHIIMSEIVRHSTHGIDLHTGAEHRSNYPQTRFSYPCEQSIHLAESFGAPIMIASNIRDGSLREATNNLNIPLIVYEAGEALRFDELAIRVGVRGVLNVMRVLQMFPPSYTKHSKYPTLTPMRAESTSWVRAPESGMIIKSKRLGDKIEKGALLCVIIDPLGKNEAKVYSPCKGLIISKTNIPLVNEGDAICRLAVFEDWERLQLPDVDSHEWD